MEIKGGIKMGQLTLEILDEVIKLVKEIHSYEVAEIIALPVISGSQDYLDWMGEEI